MIKGLILAGGLAKRMHPITKEIPKSFLPIGGIPLIVRQINLFRSFGIKEIIFSLGHLSTYFILELEPGSYYGVKFNFSIEPYPMGTAGAIRLAHRYIDDEIIVMNGDIFADFDLDSLIEEHHMNKSKFTMATKEGLFNGSEYGIVNVSKTKTIESFLEKKPSPIIETNKINAGCYMMDKSIVSNIPENRFVSLENEIIPNLLSEKIDIFAYPHNGFWFDIGVPSRYAQAEEFYKNVVAKNEI